MNLLELFQKEGVQPDGYQMRFHDIEVEITIYEKPKWKILTVLAFGKNSQEIFAALNENRDEILRIFDVESIHFPTYCNQTMVDYDRGWAKTKSCFFYGLVDCTFTVEYDVDDGKRHHFMLAMGCNTKDFLTFAVVSEMIKQQIVRKEYIDCIYQHSVDMFCEKFKDDFAICEFSTGCQYYAPTDFSFEEFLFDHCSKVPFESLTFRAKVVRQQEIDDWLGGLM